ncbi:MAG: hypothetical protein AB2375_07615 [Tissierellaceae bacterium]
MNAIYKWKDYKRSQIYHQIGLDRFWNNGKDLTVVEEKDLPNKVEDLETRKI